jgi:hypothetical protein
MKPASLSSSLAAQEAEGKALEKAAVLINQLVVSVLHK